MKPSLSNPIRATAVFGVAEVASPNAILGSGSGSSKDRAAAADASILVGVRIAVAAGAAGVAVAACPVSTTRAGCGWSGLENDDVSTCENACQHKRMWNQQ